MDGRTQIAAVLVAGYLLGRTKKMKLALTVAGAIGGRQILHHRGELISKAAKMLESSPEARSIVKQVRTTLLEAATGAAVTAASRGIGSLSDSLQDRAEKLREPKPDGDEPQDDEPQDDEPQDEREEPEDEEPEDDEPQDEREEPEDSDTADDGDKKPSRRQSRPSQSRPSQSRPSQSRSSQSRSTQSRSKASGSEQSGSKQASSASGSRGGSRTASSTRRSSGRSQSSSKSTKSSSA